MTHSTIDTKVAALIFDMGGTMVDSMPHHWVSWVEFALKHLQLNPAPDAIARVDEGLTGKPTPAIFLEAVKRIKTQAERCILFENVLHGIEAGRRAGMRAVAICTGHTAAELAGPHVIATVANCHELLDSNFLEDLHVAASY